MWTGEATFERWGLVGSGPGGIEGRDPPGAGIDPLPQTPSGGIPSHSAEGMRGALRLVRFRGAAGGGPRLGLEEAPGGDLVDLSTAEPELPRSMREFLEIGPRGLALAQRWVRPRMGLKNG